MSKIKSIFHIDIKLYYIFLILQLFFNFIKCEEDCTECSLDINDLVCKKSGTTCNNCFSNFETKKCYNKVDNVNYYTINNKNEINSMDDSGCQNKVIHKTNECVGHCPKGTYELGDFCYLKNELSNVYVDEIFGTLECNNKYIIEEDYNNKNKKYNCLDSVTSCNSINNKEYQYYDEKTHQCIKECVNKKRKIESNGDIRCSDECKSNEYQYLETDGQKVITYCSGDPGDKCKYYYVSQTEVKICINECYKHEVYKYEYNSICYIKCPKRTSSSLSNKYFCELEQADCIEEYPFLIIQDNYCFDDCNFTFCCKVIS